MLEQEDSLTFKVINEDGVEMECEVLCTFESDETGHSYLIYTDNTDDENGNTKVYASIYDPDGEDMTLQPIETEEEWALIEAILDELQSSFDDEV